MPLVALNDVLGCKGAGRQAAPVLGDEVAGEAGRQRLWLLRLVRRVAAKLGQLGSDARGASVKVDHEHASLDGAVRVAGGGGADSDDAVGAVPAVQQLLAEERARAPGRKLADAGSTSMSVAAECVRAVW